MHPCVPFRSGVPLTFLVHPSLHRAHRLKSTNVEDNLHTLLSKKSFMQPSFFFDKPMHKNSRPSSSKKRKVKLQYQYSRLELKTLDSKKLS